MPSFLNVWVNSGSPWIDIAKLQACGDTSLREEDFRGDTCYTGTDLASKTDIASKVKNFFSIFCGLLDDEVFFAILFAHGFF